MGGGLGIDVGRGFRHVSSALLGLVNPGDMAVAGIGSRALIVGLVGARQPR